jgi:phosphoribosylaminoimidazole synthetase
VLVQGARPLFFLDTIAAQRLEPEIVGRIVDGMAEACRAAGCILLGGETAEMPGVFVEGAVDIAGTMVGVVARSKLLPKAGIEPGHVLVGIASSGLHTNGYSLARQVAGDLHEPLPGGDGESIGAALCATHRSYFGVLADALEADLLDAMAHITGGGLLDNLPRVLPAGVGAAVDTGSWPRSALFEWLITSAGLDTREAHRIFNCGVGMVCVVAPERVQALQDAIGEETWVIGETTRHSGEGERVRLT